MYQVVETKTNKAVATGFKNRETARTERDERNGGPSKNDGANLKFVISRGEEHPLGPSVGVNKIQSKRWV